MTSGKVMRMIVRVRLAPMTCEASSSDGSIDFMSAAIMTKATEPSKSAMTHAMPYDVLMSMRCPCPPSARQIPLMKPLSG